MSFALLDVNVLVALTSPDHAHHSRARSWFSSRRQGGFATCPLTQLGLVRVAISLGRSPAEASELLTLTTGHPDHELVPADLPVSPSVLRGVAGHRQVTDFYLASLARRHAAALITFDRGLHLAHPDVVELVEG